MERDGLERVKHLNDPCCVVLGGKFRPEFEEMGVHRRVDGLLQCEVKLVFVLCVLVHNVVHDRRGRTGMFCGDTRHEASPRVEWTGELNFAY